VGIPSLLSSAPFLSFSSVPSRLRYSSSLEPNPFPIVQLLSLTPNACPRSPAMHRKRLHPTSGGCDFLRHGFLLSNTCAGVCRRPEMLPLALLRSNIPIEERYRTNPSRMQRKWAEKQYRSQSPIPIPTARIYSTSFLYLLDPWRTNIARYTHCPLANGRIQLCIISDRTRPLHRLH